MPSDKSDTPGENKKNSGESSEDKASKELKRKQEEVNLEKATLENETAKLELVKLKAEVETKKREAAFPKGDSKPIEGKIDANEKFGYVAELVAYHSMRQCASKIAQQINEKLHNPADGAKVLLVDTLNFMQGDFARIQIESQFNLFEERFQAMRNALASLEEKIDKQLDIPTSMGVSEETKEQQPLVAAMGVAGGLTAGLFAVSSIASLLADIAGFFRSDYSIKGRDVKLSDEALRASVAGKITQPTYFFNFGLIAESDTLTSLRKLLDGKISNDVIKNRIAEKVKSSDNKELTAKAQVILSEWQTLSDAFDNYIKSVASVQPNSQELPLLIQAASRDQIRKNGITHLLYLKTVSSGGEAITRKWFWGDGQMAFLGGCAVSFVLAKTDGEVVAADTVSGLSQYEFKLFKDNSSSVRAVLME